MYCIFFTLNTPYEFHARICLESFSKWGLNVGLVPMTNSGDWMMNCMARANKLKEIAENMKEGVGLLDADLKCLKDPLILKAFPESGYDVAVHDLGADKEFNKRFSAGVLAFNKGRGIECLHKWVELCAKDGYAHERIREQIYLKDAILGDPLLNVLNIGQTYNRTLDDQREGDDTVILHLVASRFCRKIIGGSL